MNLDLGPSDVHKPGLGDGKKGKPLPSAKRRKKKPRLAVNITHPIHGSITVSSMSDGAATMFGASLPFAKDAAGEPGKRVWVQIAKMGEFRGHHAGHFRLDDKVFADIVRNFTEIDGGLVAFDFEHASESDASSGSVPTQGAPAQGKIHQLDNRGPGGLWALVEWLEPARTYIAEGKYWGVSPTIRFGAKHPTTGQAIGARLSSAAITNKPFLRGMAPLAASDGAAGTFCFSVDEVLPRVRVALHLGDLATAAECKDRLGRLEDYLDAAGGDAGRTVQGVKLSEHLYPLRDLAGATVASTWEQVFDALHALVDEATDDADGEEPGQENDDAATAALGADAPQEATTMDQKEFDLKLSAAEASKNELTLQLKSESAKVAALEAQVKELRDGEEKRALADRAREVDEAVAVYGKPGSKAFKGIGKDDKPALVALLTSAPDAFRKLYPPIDPDKRHLLADVATGRPQDERQKRPESRFDSGTGGAPTSVIALTDRIQAERKCSYEEAQSFAFLALNIKLDGQ